MFYSKWLLFTGLCNLIGEPIKRPIKLLLIRWEKQKTLMLHKIFILKQYPLLIEPVSSKNIRKQSCCDSCAPLGFVPSKVSNTNNWIFCWCLVWKCCKSITTIKRVAVELVTYWNLCKWKILTKTSLIRYWSKCLTVGWYLGIGEWGKILYTCNTCFLIGGFFGSGDLKFTRWGFCLWRFSPSWLNRHVKFIFRCT